MKVTIEIEVKGPVHKNDVAAAVNRVLPQVESLVRYEVDTRRQGDISARATARVDD